MKTLIQQGFTPEIICKLTGEILNLNTCISIQFSGHKDTLASKGAACLPSPLHDAANPSPGPATPASEQATTTSGPVTVSTGPATPASGPVSLASGSEAPPP